MLGDKVLEDGGFGQVDCGFRLQIRLPWYRSLPLSTVEIARLCVDSQVVADENIQFSLGTFHCDLRDMAALTKRYWFVLDSAELLVKGPTPVRDVHHEIEIQMALYPPYVRGLKRIFRCEKKMQLVEQSN